MIGIDLTGAISVKKDGHIVNCYVVLFTCFATRAIHLEIAYSLSEDELIRCFTRFSARRSFPQKVYSDNGTNLTSAAKTLRSASKSSKIARYLEDHLVEWSFIPPRTPWHGGLWERMIGLTKTCIKKVIGKALLNANEFETLVTQVEMRLNDRPLTYTSNDSNDLLPITPSQLIYGFRLGEFPSLIDEEEINDPSFGGRKDCSARFVHRTRTLNAFWNRWFSEYIAGLRERHGTKDPKFDRLLCEGQVVLISDKNLPRVGWQLGLIVKLFRGSDGKVRTVELRTAKGLITRAISHLYPLELHCDLEDSVREDLQTDLRPTRESAVKARANIRAML